MKNFIFTTLLFSGLPYSLYAKSINKIVGGSLSDAQPFFAALYTEDSPIIGCGASFIQQEFLVTAAHCVENLRAKMFVNVGFDKTGRETYPRLEVESIIIHPNYSGDTRKGNDVAVIKLKPYDARKLGLNIQPIQLNKDDRIGRGQDWWRTYSVFGVGNTTSVGDLFETRLRKINVDVFKKEKCLEFYTEQVLPDSVICAGKEVGGIDSCEGDSGGPLITTIGESETPVLVGIVSWGMGCAQKQKPGVYTRVSAMTPWIEQTIDRWSQPIDQITLEEVKRFHDASCYTGGLMRSDSIIERDFKAFIDYRYPLDNFQFVESPSTNLPGERITTSCSFDIPGVGVFEKFVERKADSFQYVIAKKDGSLRLENTAFETVDRVRLHCDQLSKFVLNFTPSFTYLMYANEVYTSKNEIDEDLTVNTETTVCKNNEMSGTFYKKMINNKAKYFFKVEGEIFGAASGKIVQMSLFKPGPNFLVHVKVNENHVGQLSIENITQFNAVSWELSCDFPFVLTDEFGMRYVAEQGQFNNYNLTFYHPAQYHAILAPQVKKFFDFSSNAQINSGKCVVNNRTTEFKVEKI